MDTLNKGYRLLFMAEKEMGAANLHMSSLRLHIDASL